jgi:hypothetical protein
LNAPTCATLPVGPSGNRTTGEKRVGVPGWQIGACAGDSNPSPEVLQRLAGTNVLRTDENGTIVVETDGEQMWVTVER